jgi:CRP-like cAMP-binding protein
MSERTMRKIVEFLGTVPFLEGGAEADLVELAQVMRRRTVREGEILWRQGDDAREMLFIAEGGVSVSLHLPGDRVVQMATVGSGEIVGEIALLDGGPNTMSVEATEATTVLALGRADFAALLARPHPWSFALKRRLASLVTSRLRSHLQYLAGSLGDEMGGSPAEEVARTFAELEYCSPPNSKYIRRLATFNAFDPVALWGFLTSGRYARCPSGRTLIAEGAPSTACYLTINGAVEKVLIRGDRRIRVGLAGPGKAFGYESLIDGRPSPVTAITRERALLLVLPRDPFEQLFNGEDAISRVFLDVIQRDIVATLRQTLRPLARQASARPVSPASPAAPLQPATGAG